MTAGDAAGGEMYPAGEQDVVDIGSRHFVAPYGAGFTWWHDCPAVAHVSWGWFGPVAPDRTSGHRIAVRAPLTVDGSLLCTDCGDHGFIRDGRWVAA